MKIGIIGIGAIGGYITAMLCNNKENQVYVVAKDETLKAVKKDGIILKSELHGNIHAVPCMVTDKTEDIGIMDIVFVCVKGISLQSVAKKIEPMIGEYTLVVPIVNGVEIASRLYEYLNKGQVLETAAYIRAWVEAPGIYRHKNKTTKFIISACRKHPVYNINLEIINEVLNRSGIKCDIGRDAETEIWNRYVFNCAFNITDSYYDVGVQGILEDKMKFETFCNVAKECEMVGRKKGVKLNDNIISIAIKCLKNLSKKSVSAMHKDMIFGRKFELELYCGDLCRMAEDMGITIPYCRQAYDKLKLLQPA